MQDNNNISGSLYTITSNNILSKNIALDCIVTKLIDCQGTDEEELTEAAQSLITEQAEDIQKLRVICIDGLFVTELMRIASKNIGITIMTERLINEGDTSGDLQEALLCMIQSQNYDIQIIRTKISSF